MNEINKNKVYIIQIYISCHYHLEIYKQHTLLSNSICEYQNINDSGNSSKLAKAAFSISGQCCLSCIQMPRYQFVCSVISPAPSTVISTQNRVHVHEVCWGWWVDTNISNKICVNTLHLITYSWFLIVLSCTY